MNLLQLLSTKLANLNDLLIVLSIFLVCNNVRVFALSLSLPPSVCLLRYPSLAWPVCTARSSTTAQQPPSPSAVTR